MRNTSGTTMRKLILGMTVAAGLLTTGVVAANAAPQEFRGRVENRAGRTYEGRGFERRGYEGRGFEGREFRERGPRFGYGGGYVGGGFGYAGGAVVEESYIPPCPGDGYLWTAGYYDGGVWIPGAWRFGGGRGFGRGYGYGQGFEQRGFAGRGFAGRGFEGRGVAYNHGGDRGFNRDFHGRR